VEDGRIYAYYYIYTTPEDLVIVGKLGELNSAICQNMEQAKLFAEKHYRSFREMEVLFKRCMS
jgi:hypothetical protein